MGDDNRCEECERLIGTHDQPKYKVPAWICETILNQRFGGTRTISHPTKDWHICRDCCGETLLGVKPVYVPFDPNMYGPPGSMYGPLGI